MELDAATSYAILAADDEKNCQGSEIPLCADHAADIRQWIKEKQATHSGTEARFTSEPLFAVPSNLLKVLNRDLAAAGIPTNATEQLTFTPCR